MMLASPRIVVIDDQPEHLLGLADCLNRRGFACLRVHFTGDPADVTASPDVRIIFADLHLGMGNPSDHKTNFSMIGGLLRDSIKPSGPYIIIVWTQFPEQAESLRAFLERLDSEVAKPFDVRPLAKADHLDANGKVKDQEALVNAIYGMVRDSPQLAAMFDWEAPGTRRHRTHRFVDSRIGGDGGHGPKGGRGWEDSHETGDRGGGREEREWRPIPGGE